MTEVTSSNLNLNTNTNLNYKFYNQTNRFYETIEQVPLILKLNEKNKIILEFEKLHWESLDNYYKITNRSNLLSFNFIFWKIIEKLQKINFKFENNIEFDYQITKILNNPVQNMLWEIICPDDMEFS